MKKAVAAWLLVLVVLGVPFLARAAEIEKAEILRFGVYKTDRVEKVAAEGAAAGTRTIVKNIVLVEQTVNIPARAGVQFGFQYVIKGTPIGDKIDITNKYFHPQMTNPKTNRLFTSQVTRSRKEIGEVLYIGYTFDSEWEAVPGEWTLQVLHGDRKLAEKTFYMRK